MSCPGSFTGGKMNHFGIWLYKEIKSKGTTQSELCKVTGVSTQTISQYVNGKAIPKMQTLWLICKALNADFMSACAAIKDDLEAGERNDK